MSQRDEGFLGGVQPGTTASGAESVSTEATVRAAARQEGAAAPGGAVWRSGLSGRALGARLGVDGAGLQGCYPDGGLWLAGDGTVLCAVEAKKQGEAGNAIERWYKNRAVLERLGCRVYLTVCVGDGFFDGRSAQRCLETAVALSDGDRGRLGSGTVWNEPSGSIWLYRYRTAADVATADVAAVVRAAVLAATSR